MRHTIMMIAAVGLLSITSAGPASAAATGTPVLNAAGKCIDSVSKKFVDPKLCAAPAKPGKGVKCGKSYIAAGKKCTKPTA